MNPQTVAPGVLRLAQPGVNLYYLTAERTLVDTGLGIFASALSSFLEAFPVSLILLTHADADHAGGVSRLGRKRPLPPVAASPPEAARLAGEPRRAGVPFRFRRSRSPLPIERIVEGGERIGAFTVLATPGHSPGHISLFRESDGVLVAGDAVRVFASQLARPRFNHDERRAIRSLLSLALLPVTTVCPGHGSPLAVGPADFIQAAR